MTTNNDRSNPPDDMDLLKQDAPACGPGCNCDTPGTSSRNRWIIGVIVLAAAGVLVARAMVKDDAEPAIEEHPGFATLAVDAQTPASKTEGKQAVTDALKEIDAFSELNTVAVGSAGVFIYVPAKGDSAAPSPVALMQDAARTIEPQVQGKIGLFTLKAGSPDYEQISMQMPVPGVIVLVPGGRMVPVTGDITEAKLIQGFVGSVQSCGAGGCGPRGCG